MVVFRRELAHCRDAVHSFMSLDPIVVCTYWADAAVVYLNKTIPPTVPQPPGPLNVPVQAAKRWSVESRQLPGELLANL